MKKILAGHKGTKEEVLAYIKGATARATDEDRRQASAYEKRCKICNMYNVERGDASRICPRCKDVKGKRPQTMGICKRETCPSGLTIPHTRNHCGQ